MTAIIGADNHDPRICYDVLQLSAPKENISPLASFFFFLRCICSATVQFTVYHVFFKRIKLTSILLSRGVALTDLTRTALSELKCYDEYLN